MLAAWIIDQLCGITGVLLAMHTLTRKYEQGSSDSNLPTLYRRPTCSYHSDSRRLASRSSRAVLHRSAAATDRPLGSNKHTADRNTQHGVDRIRARVGRLRGMRPGHLSARHAN